MTPNKTSKNIKFFYCKNCDFKCCKKGDYNRHVLTRKHEIATNGNIYSIKKTSHVCDVCNKEYQDRTGLWRHKKKCSELIEENMEEDGEQPDENIVKMVLEENKKLQNLVMDLTTKIGNNNTVNSNNNITNNNTFNIQVFLNENCKNALSITDFVNSLQLQLEDLMYSKKNGTIEGISNIIVKNLNELEVEKRPVHCTDIKRETLYIKDEAGWIKEGKENDKLKRVISVTQQKHGKLLQDWQAAHPGWEDSDRLTEEFHELVQRLTFKDGGENKIIKNIAKEVVIDKESVKES
jgi:hypothetical protein